MSKDDQPMGTCWSQGRQKVGATPVLSKAVVDGKAMYSYDNSAEVDNRECIYDTAADSPDSGAEVSEDTLLHSLARHSRVKHLASQESLSADSFLSHPGNIGVMTRQRTDSLKVECGSCIWRYITPSPRSLDERNFVDISDDDKHGSEPSTFVTKINKIDSANISDDKSFDDGEAFWIPDTLARHMGIWTKVENSKKVKLKRSVQRIYANDEDIFMSVENNLGRFEKNDNDNVFVIGDQSLDNSVTDFSYNSNENVVVGDTSEIENDVKNNNSEVQLSVPSLIFIENKTNKANGIKMAKDWVSFDDKYNYEGFDEQEGF